MAGWIHCSQGFIGLTHRGLHKVQFPVIILWISHIVFCPQQAIHNNDDKNVYWVGNIVSNL